jgi:hypothetical protein
MIADLVYGTMATALLAEGGRESNRENDLDEAARIMTRNHTTPRKGATDL